LQTIALAVWGPRYVYSGSVAKYYPRGLEPKWLEPKWLDPKNGLSQDGLSQNGFRFIVFVLLYVFIVVIRF